jgi:hypothetical protein
MPLPSWVAGEDHRFLVAEQLRQIGAPTPAILLEPIGRNTAPAIAAAALAGDGRWRRSAAAGAALRSRGARCRCVPQRRARGDAGRGGGVRW